MTILDLRPTGFTYTATVVGRVTHVSGLPYDVSVRNKGPTTIFKVHITDQTSTVELTAWGTPAHIALFVLGKIVVLTNLRVTALEERFRLFNCAVQVHYSTNSKVRPLGDADDTTLEATIPVTSHSPYIPPTQSLMESPQFQAPDESPSKASRRSNLDSPSSSVTVFPPILCQVCGKDERTVPFCRDADEPYTMHTKRCPRCGCTKLEHRNCEHTGAPHE